MAIRFIYTLLLVLVAPFLLLSLYKNKPGKPKFGSRWKEHWGQTPKTDGVDPIFKCQEEKTTARMVLMNRGTIVH